MNAAVIGCGYVADFYASTAGSHPGIALSGAFDVDGPRADAFCALHGLRRYADLDALLRDDAVGLVLNLTNPRAHAQVTRACLEAGKHVYSEKPLAMSTGEASALAALARQRGLRLGAAPCSVLGRTAQTVWKALREGAIGNVRLVYASYDEGLIAPRMAPWTWTSASGAPWPARDEFEVGCTFEHAGYVLTWLAAFFGPARRVTSFSCCLTANKGIAVDEMAPDFSVGCLEYDGGVVARLTCGLLAPRDKSLLIVGEEGHLVVGELRDDTCPVHVHRHDRGGALDFIERLLNRARRWTRRGAGRLPWPRTPWRLYRRYPDAIRAPAHRAGPDKPVDFMLGAAEMAEAIAEGRPHRLSADLGVHVVELVEALQHPRRGDHQRTLQTDCPRMEPLPWR